jgi:hypothetical protein
MRFADRPRSRRSWSPDKSGWPPRSLADFGVGRAVGPASEVVGQPSALGNASVLVGGVNEDGGELSVSVHTDQDDGWGQYGVDLVKGHGDFARACQEIP